MIRPRLVLAVLAVSIYVSLADPNQDPESVETKVVKPAWYRQPSFYLITLLQLASTIISKPQTPLLGAKAARSGISTETLGVILALMPLCSALASPLIGLHLNRIGMHRTLAFGSITMTLSGAAFGLLDFMDGNLFFAVAIALRIIFGIGNAARQTASSTYWNSEYKEFASVHANASVVVGLIGMLIPPACSLLNHGHGYYMSFLVFGLLSLLIVAICITALPYYINQATPLSPADFQPRRRPSLLRIPGAMAALLMIIVTLASSGLIGVLVPHVFAGLHVSDANINWVFSASALAWMCGDKVASHLAEYANIRPAVLIRIYTLVAVLAVIAFALVQQPLALTAATALLSFSTSVTHTAGGIEMGWAAKPHGDAMLALATGLKNGGTNCGEALGNIAGGILYSRGSLSITSYVFSAVCIMALIVYQVWNWFIAKAAAAAVPADSLTAPLLRPSRRTAAAPEEQ